jgi:hypothetical protein
MSNSFVKILDKPIFNQPVIVDKKPKKVKQEKVVQPKIIKEPKVIIQKTLPTIEEESIKLTPKDYTNKKLDSELKLLEKNKSKLEDEITNNQNLLKDKLSEIVKLNKIIENLNELKKENNLVINI